MTGDLHAQLTKLLHTAPNLGTAGAQLFRDASPAHDDGGIIAEQAHDATQATIGASAGNLNSAFCGQDGDRGIMRVCVTD